MKSLAKSLNCSLIKKQFSILVFFFLLFFRLNAQDEYEICTFEAEAAWEGDTAALHKFVATCGKIDTLNLDSLNQRVEKNAHYQKITMRLNNGKIFRSDSVFFVAEKMPEFPGGLSALLKYLNANLKYPKEAVERNINGKVSVTFIIGRDGSVSHIKVTRGIGGGCDEEAMRVVRQMPKWTPGKVHDKPVRVQYNLPVRFSMR